MGDDRDDGWLAYADTAKQVALAEDRRAVVPPPKKVPLAAIEITKSGERADAEERPDSAIREIPARLSPNDPRADEDAVPPLDVDVDLD